MISLRESEALKAKWEVRKAKLKMKFPKLSDQDLNFDEINKAEMFRQLEVKLALTAKELQGIMNTPINDLREKLP